MALQLPLEDYVATKACIQARAKAIPSDGETRWDQRCCDVFLDMVRSADGDFERPSRNPASARSSRGQKAVAAEHDNQSRQAMQPSRSPYFAVLHAPLHALIDREGVPTDLAGDLEQGGLISLETVSRLLCDSTFAIAVDDKSGHTMYEGRQRRLPTGAQRREIWRRDRCCRFPGCRNKIFTQPHHLKWWIKGGPTDLSNLALLCSYHHHLMHHNGWSARGDANEELTFAGPNGRTTSSSPSSLWTV